MKRTYRSGGIVTKVMPHFENIVSILFSDIKLLIGKTF